MSESIYIKSLTVGFNGSSAFVEILHDIDLSVNNGEYIAIVGSSGSGKSTLLRTIAGTLFNFAPSSQIAGDMHLAENNGSPARISLMPQGYALLPWRNLLDNIFLSIELLGEPIQKKHYNKALELMKYLSISQHKNLFHYQLSGGIAQRTALARSLMPETDILLLDEPLNAVDIVERERIQPILRKYVKKSGSTTIHVTHDLYEAAFMADHIYVIGGNPASIQSRFSVPDVPRTNEFRESTEYLKLVKKLRAFLNNCYIKQ